MPDRKAETAKAWMQAHPEIKLISRDRGGDSAAAAREGAPQATHMADRFQREKNLVEAVKLTCGFTFGFASAIESEEKSQVCGLYRSFAPNDT